MSSRSPRLYVEDILQASREIVEFTRETQNADEFAQDRRTFLAVVRSIEVIGEAARQMPRTFKAEHSDIPWKEIIGLRTVIAHEYFGLDNEILWDVIKNRIPSLLEQFKNLKTT